ncbi:MAG: endonuclease/exonuclease/phosphatase family protein [Bacteroidota bacterium]
MKLTQIYFLLFSILYGFSQSRSEYHIRTVAFYNVENLFDIVNDSLTFDDERTPSGNYHWTKERYNKKIHNISRVLSEIGNTVSRTPPDIIGLCEVENRTVIEDLIYHKNLRNTNYGVIHFDSPDERGIDVALVYKKTAFIPASFRSHRLLLFDHDGKRDYTRDQLVVGGYLDSELFYFIVNHWPSRSGGEARSKPNRIKAAQLNKRIIDSIQRITRNAKIISMGDLNDDPRDDALKKYLKTIGHKNQLDSLSLYNPMEKMYRQGHGSLAYRDTWNLFDQFFFTSNLISIELKGYSFWKAGIFNPDYLKIPTGRYRGYPFRTYVGTSYQGGYADHFPVYLYLIKKARP